MSTSELYKRHRPRRLSDVVGQDGALASLQRLIDRKEIPHAILLTGPSGTGKTTIARILRRHLQCGKMDYEEIDCAVVDSPIDTVRKIKRNMGLSPMDGPCKIWFLEEAQSLSRAGFSQQAMLKLIEDVPSHVYLILATTDAQKLHRAVLTRCTEIKLVSMSRQSLGQLIRDVIAKEKMTVKKEIQDEIVDAADGSARKALVILEQVGSLPEKQQLAAIQSTSVNKEASIVLARALINPRTNWHDVARILKELTDEPESVRMMLLGYCKTVLLGGGPLAARAYMIIDLFSGHLYESRHAGLAARCWEVLNPQQ